MLSRATESPQNACLPTTATILQTYFRRDTRRAATLPRTERVTRLCLPFAPICPKTRTIVVTALPDRRLSFFRHAFAPAERVAAQRVHMLLPRVCSRRRALSPGVGTVTQRL